jgi:hypothetical protein
MYTLDDTLEHNDEKSAMIKKITIESKRVQDSEYSSHCMYILGSFKAKKCAHTEEIVRINKNPSLNESISLVWFAYTQRVGI